MTSAPQQQQQQQHCKQSLCCVDPVLLRRALRLVHCLQKERGASCAFYVSRHGHNILENMERARVDSDRAVQMMLSGGKGELKILSTLMKIRKMVVNDPSSSTTASGSGGGNTTTTTQSALTSSLQQAGVDDNADNSHERSIRAKKISSSCHRILACFNALISSLVHDFFMEKIAKQARSLQAKLRKGSRGQTSNSNLANLVEEKIRSRGKHRRVQSHCAAFSDPLAAAASMTAQPFDVTSIGGIIAPKPKQPGGMPGSLPSLFIDLENLPGGEAPMELPGLNDVPQHRRSGSMDASPTKGVQFVGIKKEEPEEVLSRLLNLLACFVKLKESTGVERAILSTLVVLGKGDSLLMSDLVLEVENQRRLLDELKNQPVGPLRNLVQELVEMSTPLHELQQKILKNFDLDGIFINESEQDVTKVWDLITVYIDKLHSLELLIIEEVEYCLPSLELDNSHDHHHHHNHHHHDHNGTPQPALLQSDFIKNMFGPSASEETVRNRLEKMPADEIKDKLLQGLTLNNKEVPNDNSHHSLGLVIGEEVAGLIEDPFAMTNLPATKEWEINLYELKFLKRIGEGAAGTTYLANWTGLEVAVKVASITEMGLDGWRTEVQSLQKLHHPNIIRLMGSVYHQNPLTYCLVLEYCNAGDLGAAMKYPTAPEFFFHVATSIAKGMAYLHSRGVMHRDIKPENILLDGNVRNGYFSVKVTDFGVATDTNDALGDRTAETGTYRWMSPEVIRHESYSNMADVYSFAVVLWQLLSREEPYTNISQIEAAGKVAIEKARPPFPRGTPADIVELIKTCWSENPSDRYSFEEICTKQLPETQSKLSSAEQTWLDAPLGNPVYFPREDQKKTKTPDGGLVVPLPNMASQKQAAQKRKEERGKDENKKKSGFFKIKMFGH